MPSRRRVASLLLTSVALVGARLALAAGPSNLDAFQAHADAFAADPDVQALRAQREQAARAATASGFPSEFDRRLGVPTFLWTAGASAPALRPLPRTALIEAWGREHLTMHAPALGLSADVLSQAELTDLHDLGRGALIARFQQRHQGLPVFNRRLNVVMRQDGTPVAISGYFAVDERAPAAVGFSVPAEQAVQLAFAELAGSSLAASPRVKQVLYPLPPVLEPAYYVELQARAADGALLAYSFVISADDGATLFRKNLASQAAHTYRVFADLSADNAPYHSPLGNAYAPFPGAGPDEVIPRTGVPSALVTLDHGPIAAGDPWLPEGADATTGNNVDAYMDSGPEAAAGGASVTPTNTYVEGSGDTRATATAPGAFDYAIEADADPAESSARNAANVNLFYVANWLHDWWYGHGFDEAAGNAQQSNLGRGGLEGDPLVAQGQDGTGRNNANMITPADGASPIMQMYLWDAFDGEVVWVEPGSRPAFAFAPYSPASFDLTQPVVLANDLTGASFTDGCSDTHAAVAAPPQATLEGKIALLDQGGCDFTTKTRFAETSGAVAAVIVLADEGVYPAPALATTVDTLNIPSVLIRRVDGEQMKQVLAGGGSVSLKLRRQPLPDYDGALDNQVIAHEHFHHVSNRLVSDAAGLGNSQGKGLGEGWSDMAALLLTLRTGGGLDRAYGLAGYTTDEFYFGVRRYPYSTSFAVDPLTFRHIANGEPLPSTAPRQMGTQVNGGESPVQNALPHSSGEVWATMLLECYAGLVGAEGNDVAAAQALMKDHLIAGLKATPASPTFTEARDALLAAALAADPQDFNACAAGFARRGAGTGAQSPERASTDHAGVVESYAAPVAQSTTRVGESSSVTNGGTLGAQLLFTLCAAGLARRRIQIQLAANRRTLSRSTDPSVAFLPTRREP